MADNSDAEAAQGQGSASQALMDQSVLGNYIRRIVPVHLEDSDDTPAALVTSLKDKSTLDSMKKFISDPQVQCLLIQRQTTKGIHLTVLPVPPVSTMDWSNFDSCQTLVKPLKS